MSDIRDLGINLLAAFLGFLMAKAYSRIRYLRRTYVGRRFWSSFKSSGEISIVLSGWDDPSIVRFEASGLVGIGDVRSVLDLQKEFLRLGRSCSVVEAKRLLSSDAPRDLVIVGGPDSNEWAKSAFELLRSPLRFTFSRVTGGAVLDRTTGARYSARSDADGVLEKDVGVIVLARSPFSGGGSVLLLAGLYGYGTQAATKLVTASIESLRATNLNVREPFEAIVSVTIVNGDAIVPRIELARNSA